MAIDRIRRYYERHTQTFVTFGEGGPFGVMHRAVTGPGVTTKAGALRYVDDQVLEVARRLDRVDGLRVIDLGCGVGGSLCYLAAHQPIVGTGITLSETQVRLARQRIAACNLSDRLTVIAGDFTEPPASLTPADVVFAIESFVHTPDAATFFERCRPLVRPGGALIICDDFRRGATDGLAKTMIERYCRGWQVNTLLEPAELWAVAHAAGFEHQSTLDLTAHVDIGRRRDHVVNLLARPLERLPWRWSRLDPWLGGSALQACLRNGWLGYDFVVFRPSTNR